MKNTITTIAKEVMEIVKDKIVLLESSEKPLFDGFNVSTKHEVTFLIHNEVAFRMLSAAFNFTAIKVGSQEYPMVFMMGQLEYKGVLSEIDVRVDAGTVGAKLLAEKLEEQKRG